MEEKKEVERSIGMEEIERGRVVIGSVSANSRQEILQFLPLSPPP